MAYAGIVATVLQKNNYAFFCDGCSNYGENLNIPCGSTAAQADPAERWATPVNNDYLQGFEYHIGSKPTPDSIRVFKLTDKQNGDWYIVVGTQDAYLAACAACCDASPVPSLITSPLPQLSVQQYLCPDSNGVFAGYWALPFRDTGNRYVSIVTLGDPYVQQTPIQTYATGSVSQAALVTYLNTNYAAAGTWSATTSPLGIKLVSTTAKWVGLNVCSKSS